MSPVACGWLRGRQRVGWRQRAPCGTDELGDAVEPLLIEVVDGAVAQEFVCDEECGPCLHGSATSVGRGTDQGQRWSGGAAGEDACCSFPAGPVAMLVAGDGERQGGPPTGVV